MDLPVPHQVNQFGQHLTDGCHHPKEVGGAVRSIKPGQFVIGSFFASEARRAPRTRMSRGPYRIAPFMIHPFRSLAFPIMYLYRASLLTTLL